MNAETLDRLATELELALRLARDDLSHVKNEVGDHAKTRIVDSLLKIAEVGRVLRAAWVEAVRAEAR